MEFVEFNFIELYLNKKLKFDSKFVFEKSPIVGTIIFPTPYLLIFWGTRCSIATGLISSDGICSALVFLAIHILAKPFPHPESNILP